MLSRVSHCASEEHESESQRALDAEQPDGRYAVAIAHIRAQRHDQHGGGRVAPDSTRTAEEGGSRAPHGHEPQRSHRERQRDAHNGVEIEFLTAKAHAQEDHECHYEHPGR